MLYECVCFTARYITLFYYCEHSAQPPHRKRCVHNTFHGLKSLLHPRLHGRDGKSGGIGGNAGGFGGLLGAGGSVGEGGGNGGGEDGGGGTL